VSETAPEPRPAAGGKKILGLRPTTFYLAVGGAVIVGLAFYWWRNYQAGVQQAASTANGTTGTSTDATDYSGQLSTIQTELESLLQQQGVGTSTSSGNGGGGGGWSGWGGGGTGGDSSGSGSSGSSGSSGGSTGINGAGSSAGSGSTSSSSSSKAPAAPTGGHVVSVNANDVKIAWNANGATKWTVKTTGPGNQNGRVGTVTSPQASYSGLEAGHNYEFTVTPYNSAGQAGPSGVISVVTK
jgi:hypothetical protein